MKRDLQLAVALGFAFALGAAAPAFAQAPNADIRQDQRDIQHDRNEQLEDLEHGNIGAAVREQGEIQQRRANQDATREDLNNDMSNRYYGNEDSNRYYGDDSYSRHHYNDDDND